jgi:hypothetical protein
MPDLDLKEQQIDYSGVGEHHLNGVAERALQTEIMHRSPSPIATVA